MRKNKKTLHISDITKSALCIAFLCVASYMVIPLPFTPVVLSMHTVAVNLTGLILSPENAVAVIVIYLLMGMAGLPVFAGGTGFSKLFGPTGGFYFGFLITVFIISILKGKEINLKKYIIITIAVGIPVQHLCAVLFMCIYSGCDVLTAFINVSAPFIAGDILKCIVASVCAVRINKALVKNVIKK